MALMTCPIEIREQILELALLADTTKPPNDATTLTRELRKAPLPENAEIEDLDSTITAGEYFLLKKRLWGPGSLPVFYRTGTCRDMVLPLLLVSRQVHAETKTVLDRTVKQSVWNADVMFIKNVGLWTTWLSASRFLRNVDTLHAQFRSFNAPENLDPTFFNGHMWRAGCGGPAVGVWGFYDLLMGVLEGIIGPFPRRRETDGPEGHVTGRRNGHGLLNDTQGITVKRLILDCLSSTEEKILPLNYTEQGRSYVLTEHQVDPALPEPKTAAIVLARFIAEMLEMIMRPALYDIDYGKALYERVGEIFIQVDGELFHHFDLSEIIARLSWERFERWESHKVARVDKAFQWRKEAIEKRRQAGFRVVDQPS